MLEGGEDPRFIVRRMVILASEDIGNADPRALSVATAAAAAVEHVGLPEARYALAQAAIYLSLGAEVQRRRQRARRRARARARARRRAGPGVAALGAARRAGAGGYDNPHCPPGPRRLPGARCPSSVAQDALLSSPTRPSASWRSAWSGSARARGGRRARRPLRAAARPARLADRGDATIINGG